GPDSYLARLVDAAGLETKAIPGNRIGLAVNGAVAASGAPETYPFRLPLSPAARLSFVKSGLRLRWAARGFQRIARRRAGESASAVRARVVGYRDDETFADYLGAMHPDIASIFRAVAERITAEPHEITAGCGAGLFALLWDSKLTMARNLMGGSALLPQTLVSHLGERVVTRATVEEDVPDATMVRVRGRRPGCIQNRSGRYVIGAAPVSVTRPSVLSQRADTAAALAHIPYGTCVCGAILTGESGPMPWDDVYAIATPGKAFNMLFNHANVLRG